MCWDKCCMLLVCCLPTSQTPPRASPASLSWSGLSVAEDGQIAHQESCAKQKVDRKRARTSAVSCRGGGGIFALGFFRTRKFRTEFISHSGLKIPRQISHPSRIVLFTSGSCTAKFQRVPGLFCEFPKASRWAFFKFRGFLSDLDLNPMPQTHLPFGCCAATNMWTPKTSLNF